MKITGQIVVLLVVLLFVGFALVPWAGFSQNSTISAAKDTAAKPATPAPTSYHYTHFFGKGINLFFEKYYKGAIESFDKVIEIKKDYALAYFYRARCHTFMKNYEQGAKDFQSFFNLVYDIPATMNEDMQYERGLCYGYTGKYLLALNDLNPYIEKNKATVAPEIYQLRGDIYYMLRNKDLALKDYTEAFGRSNDAKEKASIKSRMAKTYFDQMEIPQAVSLLDEAIALDPENAAYHRQKRLYQSFNPVEKDSRGYHIYPDDYGNLSHSK